MRAPASHALRRDRLPEGFTLVEIIAAILLVGLLGGMGTLGLVSFSKSFSISTQGADIAAKGQLALLRLSKEIVAIKTVSSASSSAITFTSVHASGDKTYTVSLSSGNLRLTEGAANDTLVDQVASFSLAYQEWDFATDTLTTTSPAAWVNEDLCCSPITLTMESTPRSKLDSGICRLRIRFTDGVSGLPNIYNVTYAGTTYASCRAPDDGVDYYNAVDNLGSTSLDNPGTRSLCSDLGGRKDIPGVSHYPKAHLWKSTTPKCYVEVAIRNGDSSGPDIDDCTVGGGANAPPYTLKGGTKIIKVNLQLQGSSEVFTVSASPRNVNTCP